MPRVIRIDPEMERQVTHKKCGAVIGYFGSEVESAIHHDYGGGTEKWWYVKCPHCGETVEVKQP